MTHSPTPWRLDFGRQRQIRIHAADGTYVCVYGDPDDFSLTETDADYLVRCVNAHEALVEALQDILKAYGYAGSEDPRWDYHKDPSVQMSLAALKLAGAPDA